MTTSFHHTKGLSELPQIPRYSPERTTLMFKSFNPLKNIQTKNPFCQLVSQNSQQVKESKIQDDRARARIGNPTKENKLIKNSYNPKSQTISVGSGLGCPNMLQKMLQKNKKYFRVDAHMKTQNNTIKNDIECLIENLVHEKQRNDFIVLNLREKFQTNKRSLTMNKRPQNLLYSNKRNSTIVCLQQPGLTCPIASVNHFTQSRGNLRSRKFGKSQQINQQKFTASCLLNTEVKNFKQIIKQYLLNYRSSMNQENVMKNFSIFSNGISQNMAGSFMSRSSGNRQTDSFGKKQDEITDKIKSQKSGNLYFREFIHLTEKSQDYLEYYLKSSFVTEFSGSGFDYGVNNQRNSLVLNQTRQEIDQMLKKMDKNAILSVLRSSSKCLQPVHNSKEIVNRILLALNINPMNEFHFIKQQTFTKFKKLTTNKASRKDSREFLLRYFCLESQQVKKQQFDNLLYCILNKLLPILNESTLQILYEKVKKICQQTILLIREQEQKENLNIDKKGNINKQNMMKTATNTKTNFIPNNNNRLSLDDEKEKLMKDSGQSGQMENGISRLKDSEYYKREEIKAMLFQDPFGMWDQMLQLIFIV